MIAVGATTGVIRGFSQWIDGNLGGVLPLRYEAPLPADHYEQLIFVNWLQAEIEPGAERRLPLLKDIRGHRNREVHYYVKDTNAIWDRILADSYGCPGACV